MEDIEPTLVEFKGTRYWWLRHDDGTGALAYLDHCDENGEVTFESFLKESYAHVHNSGISRYGKMIGTKDDLKFLAAPSPN